MDAVELNENDISYRIRGCVFKVYKALGPGLLESAYREALAYELTMAGLLVQKEVPLPFLYDGMPMGTAYRMDILVNEKVVIEVKSVEAITPLHHKQLITYLKLANKKLGILVNFNSGDITKSIFRKVNGL